MRDSEVLVQTTCNVSLSTEGSIIPFTPGDVYVCATDATNASELWCLVVLHKRNFPRKYSIKRQLTKLTIRRRGPNIGFIVIEFDDTNQVRLKDFTVEPCTIAKVLEFCFENKDKDNLMESIRSGLKDIVPDKTAIADMPSLPTTAVSRTEVKPIKVAEPPPTVQCGQLFPRISRRDLIALPVDKHHTNPRYQGSIPDLRYTNSKRKQQQSCLTAPVRCIASIEENRVIDEATVDDVIFPTQFCDKTPTPNTMRSRGKAKSAAQYRGYHSCENSLSSAPPSPTLSLPAEPLQNFSPVNSPKHYPPSANSPHPYTSVSSNGSTPPRHFIVSELEPNNCGADVTIYSHTPDKLANMEAKALEFPKYSTFNFPSTSPPREECSRKSKRRLTCSTKVPEGKSINFEPSSKERRRILSDHGITAISSGGNIGSIATTTTPPSTAIPSRPSPACTRDTYLTISNKRSRLTRISPIKAPELLNTSTSVIMSRKDVGMLALSASKSGGGSIANVSVKDKPSIHLSNGVNATSYTIPTPATDGNASDSDPDEDYTRFLSRPPKKLSTSLNGGNVSAEPGGVPNGEIEHSASPVGRTTGLPAIKANSHHHAPSLQNDTHHHVDSPSSGEFSENSLKENIFQLDEEEKEENGSLTKRTLRPRTSGKPLQEKQTNGDSTESPPSLSVASTPGVSHPHGFVNLGNTCYMNCVLQCLLSLPTFTSKLIPPSQPYKPSLYNCLSALFQQKHSKASNISSKEKKDLLIKVKNFISESTSHFRGSRQQDAHEFLGKFLDVLREERRVALKCPVYTTFQCEVIHTLKCFSCNVGRVKRENYYDFSLNLPNRNYQPHNLASLLDSYFATDVVDYICSGCGHNEAQVFHRFSKLPEALVLHVQRYAFSRGGSSEGKRQDSIHIPPKLDITKLSKDCGKESPGNRVLIPDSSQYSTSRNLRTRQRGLYSLQCVISHLGETRECGHYICDVRSNGSEWFYYDDVNMHVVDLNFVTTKRKNSCYIFFYLRDKMCDNA